MENYGLNLAFLRRLIRISALMMGGRMTLAVVCFFFLLIFAVGYEVSGYYTGLVSSQFYKVLVARDSAAFQNLIFTSILTVIATAVIKSVRTFLSKLLYIQWRKNLVNAMHGLYFQNVAFFRANFSSGIDNPDQRLTQDAERLTTTAATIVFPIIIAPFKIGFYTYRAYSTTDWVGPVAITLLFLLSTIVNKFLVSKVSTRVYCQEMAEGEFRFEHAKVRTQCESMAFYRAGDSERRKANGIFLNLLSIQHTLFTWQLALNTACQTFDYVGGILSYLVIAIPIFAGKYDDKDAAHLTELISANGFVCIMLISSFSQLVDLSSSVADVVGNTHRVGQLFEFLTLQHQRDVDDAAIKDDDRDENTMMAIRCDDDEDDGGGDTLDNKRLCKDDHDGGVGHGGGGGNGGGGGGGQVSSTHSRRLNLAFDPPPTTSSPSPPNPAAVAATNDIAAEDVAFTLDAFTCFAPDAAAASSSASDGSSPLLHHLQQQQRQILVRNLYLRFSKGSDILITGPSGVGKSSLLRTLFQLWPLEGDPSSMKWSIDYKDPTLVILLPQSPYIFDDNNSNSIISELKIPAAASLQRRPWPSSGPHALPIISSPEYLDEVRAVEALTLVGLAHLLNMERKGTWTATLSRGEKQKVSFARLLYHNPSFAILDEATSSLDEVTETKVLTLLKARGMTLLSVGHRSSIKPFHRYELRLEGRDGEWTFQQLPPFSVDERNKAN